MERRYHRVETKDIQVEFQEWRRYHRAEARAMHTGRGSRVERLRPAT